jgi:3-oxoacyl-[acyl-carrier-protein] synthase III
MLKTIITGTGSYIPTERVTNRDFAAHDFYTPDFQRVETSPEEVARKFEEITGISERRFAKSDITTTEMAISAAKIAIEDSGVDPETIDQIIFAHNFGNVVKHTIQGDAVPALASRLKQGLGIKNPNAVAYDLLFGCPGWLQGVIHADAFFKAGIAKKALVVGSETLSRVIDPYDRDSMIFSDGAGACILEFKESSADGPGILGYSAVSHCAEETNYINFGKSNFPDSDPRIRFIKMKGRKVYEYAIKNVGAAMKDCLEKSGVEIHELKKVFLHQANEKMDEGIIKILYRLYGIKELPEHIMPMSIHKLGNSSVATVPTLFDLVRKSQLENHELNPGDVILFASVGAGMNINAVAYRY